MSQQTTTIPRTETYVDSFGRTNIVKYVIFESAKASPPCNLWDDDHNTGRDHQALLVEVMRANNRNPVKTANMR